MSSQNAPCNKFTEDMLDASQACQNIHLTRLASQSETAKLRSAGSRITLCMATARERKEHDLLKKEHTNVIITTFGMASRTKN
eukprot:652780-Karenia_brevis.AAC.1